MQRKKLSDAQISSKEKIETNQMEIYNSEQKNRNIISQQINPESNIKNAAKELELLSTKKKYEISQNYKPQKSRVYVSSRYNNTRQIENTSNLMEQISINDDINNININSIRNKRSPGEISFQRDSLRNNNNKNKNFRINMNPIFNNQRIIEPDDMQINTNESIKINSSAINDKLRIQYMLIPQTKLSPIQKCDEGSSSFENRKYSENRNRLANYVNSKGNQNINIENIHFNISNIDNNLRKVSIPDERNTKGRIIQDENSPSYNNEQNRTQISNSNTVSKKELKRIVKKFNKVYDPYINEKGILLKQSQITLPGAHDEIFNNRYRVLSKMNKLSNILLAKQKREDEKDSSKENSREININIFDRNRSRSKGSKNKNNEKISNIKDITILRRYRIQKGGVVDLAQEQIKKTKFKIVKASAPKGGKILMKFNPKHRESAAKIIQGWWRELRDIYEYKLAQITKIQSIWKGRWVRKNIYDLLYLNYLYLSFCEKIEKIWNTKLTKYAFDILFFNQKDSRINNQEILKRLILASDKRRLNFIRKKWDIWIKKILLEKEKKNKGKTLLQIRTEKDNKLNKLKNCFIIWRYNTKIHNIQNKYNKNNSQKYNNNDEKEIREEINMNGKKIITITKIEEKERYIAPVEYTHFIGKNKLKGLLKIIEGANNYHKKQAFEKATPKIKKHLIKLSKIELLKKIIEKKIKKINLILHKKLNKWLNKIIIIQSENIINNSKNKTEYEKFKGKVFWNRVENIKNKNSKNLLRKYFYLFLKNALLKKPKNEEIKKMEQNNLLYNKLAKNSYHPYDRKKESEKIKIKFNNISDTIKGFKKLQNFTWRNTYIYILNCFREKIKDRKKSKLMTVIIKIKEKNIKKKMKEFMNKWKNKTLKKRNNDIISKMFIKIIKIIINNNNKKILNKRLHQWYENVKKLNDKNNKNQIKNFGNIISKLFNNNQNKLGKQFLIKLKENKKEKILKNVFIKYGKPKINIINYYFKRWKYINKKVTQIKYSQIIQRFCHKNLKNRKYEKKWKELLYLIKKKIYNDEIDEIIIYLKYYMGLSNLFNIIQKHHIKINFDKIKYHKNYNKIGKILITILTIADRKKAEYLLKKYFTKWINVVNNENRKINSLCYMLAILETKNYKKDINSLSNAFILKKLINDIMKIRALNFIQKLKIKDKKNNQFKILGNDLINAQKDLFDKNKKLVNKKIIKIYFISIISKFFNFLEKLKKLYSKKYMEEFLQKLYEIKIAKTAYKYHKIIQYNKQPKIESGLNFNIGKNNVSKNNLKINKSIEYRVITPNLVKYLSKLFRKRNMNIFDNLKSYNIANKFCKLLKISVKKSNIPDKEDLVDSFKYYVYMKLSRLSDSNKLYYIIRKSIFKKIIDVARLTGNLYRLVHLVDITFTHKMISKDRWILRIIKRWRFVTFVKKMAQKKMELMYKDLHVTYLEMADSVLREGIALESRFLPDVSMDKYLFNLNDPYLIKGSNAYKGIKKQYIFEPLDAEIERKIKEIKEIETIEKYKEINKINNNFQNFEEFTEKETFKKSTNKYKYDRYPNSSS